jgi:hypothetical protein
MFNASLYSSIPANGREIDLVSRTKASCCYGDNFDRIHPSAVRKLDAVLARLDRIEASVTVTGCLLGASNLDPIYNSRSF